MKYQEIAGESKSRGRGQPAKWDWDEARRLGKIHGRAASTIIDCWRHGRPIAPNAFTTAKKSLELDLGLEVFMSVYNGFPQPRPAIADVCGVSAEAIRVIEMKALVKMRKKMHAIAKEHRACA